MGLMMTERAGDRILAERQQHQDAEQRWLQHWSTRQLALDVFTAYRELSQQYKADFDTDDCPFSMCDLDDHFSFSAKEIETGRVEGQVVGGRVVS